MHADMHAIKCKFLWVLQALCMQVKIRKFACKNAHITRNIFGGIFRICPIPHIARNSYRMITYSGITAILVLMGI